MDDGIPQKKLTMKFLFGKLWWPIYMAQFAIVILNVTSSKGSARVTTKRFELSAKPIGVGDISRSVDRDKLCLARRDGSTQSGSEPHIHL